MKKITATEVLNSPKFYSVRAIDDAGLSEQEIKDAYTALRDMYRKRQLRKEVDEWATGKERQELSIFAPRLSELDGLKEIKAQIPILIAQLSKRDSTPRGRAKKMEALAEKYKEAGFDLKGPQDVMDINEWFGLLDSVGMSQYLTSTEVRAYYNDWVRYHSDMFAVEYITKYISNEVNERKKNEKERAREGGRTRRKEKSRVFS